MGLESTVFPENPSCHAWAGTEKPLSKLVAGKPWCAAMFHCSVDALCLVMSLWTGIPCQCAKGQGQRPCTIGVSMDLGHWQRTGFDQLMRFTYVGDSSDF